MEILTGNELMSGATVYLSQSGAWVEDLQQARVFAKQQAADPAVDAKIKADPKLFPRAGGFPLMAGTELVGAIGVGGAPGGDKDAVCAQAGIAKIQAMLK